VDHRKRMLESAQKLFNLRAEKERKWATKVDLRKTAGKGSQGPFYWLTLGPKTVLKSMPYPANGQNTMDHPDFWEAIVDSDVVPFFGISNPNVVRELKNVPYAMPRGRVVLIKRPLDNTKKFVVYHYGTLTDSQKKQIIEAFDLAGQFHAGLVTFVPDEHHAKIENDSERFLELTTKSHKRKVSKERPNGKRF